MLGSIPDRAAINAALEAEARLTVCTRHSETIGALPPDLMSAQRNLYEARRQLGSAIAFFKKSSARSI